jgi:hypothetical protein
MEHRREIYQQENKIKNRGRKTPKKFEVPEPRETKRLLSCQARVQVLPAATLPSSYTALPFRSLSEAPVFCTTINWRLVLSPPPNDLWFAAAWIVGIFQEFRTSQINFCNHAVAVLRAASQYKSNPVTTKLWLLTTLDIRIDILTQAG